MLVCIKIKKKQKPLQHLQFHIIYLPHFIQILAICLFGKVHNTIFKYMYKKLTENQDTLEKYKEIQIGKVAF